VTARDKDCVDLTVETNFAQFTFIVVVLLDAAADVDRFVIFDNSDCWSSYNFSGRCVNGHDRFQRIRVLLIHKIVNY